MISTKNSIGTRIAIIVAILTSFILSNSCTKEIDRYHVTIRNDYFETLYNISIGNIHFNTLLVNEKTAGTVINCGNYDFTAETESGLVLQAVVYIRGENPQIALVINEHGKLIKE